MITFKLLASNSNVECTKNSDCNDDKQCDDGKCVGKRSF